MKDANLAAVIAFLGIITLGILEAITKQGSLYPLSFAPGILVYLWFRWRARRVSKVS